jgi:hypothetical protein
VGTHRPQTGYSNSIPEFFADLDTPYEPVKEAPKEKRSKRQKYYKLLMNSPWVPLVFRITVISFSVAALGLAAENIRFNLSNTDDPKQSSNLAFCRAPASSYLAIAFDSVAVVYSLYIAYDEFFSTPLGLRSHTAKLSLIFLDLIFMIFNSANVALAFESVFDVRWACNDNPENAQQLNEVCAYDGALCRRQKSLTAVLMVSLIAWLTTFTISTMRIVDNATRT